MEIAHRQEVFQRDHICQLHNQLCKNKIGITPGKTLWSKEAFDQYSSKFGVNTKGFLADNVNFGSYDFIQNVKYNSKTLYFSRTGDHN